MARSARLRLEDRRQFGSPCPCPSPPNLVALLSDYLSRWGWCRETGIATADKSATPGHPRPSVLAEAARFPAATSRRSCQQVADVNPKVLILDEPTRGIDVGGQGRVHDMINDLAKQELPSS